jgi:hypothetical protein
VGTTEEETEELWAAAATAGTRQEQAPGDNLRPTATMASAGSAKKEIDEKLATGGFSRRKENPLSGPRANPSSNQF